MRRRVPYSVQSQTVGAGTSRADPAAGAVGDVPDWSGSGSEEIAMKEEVVYDDEADLRSTPPYWQGTTRSKPRSLRHLSLSPHPPLRLRQES